MSNLDAPAQLCYNNQVTGSGRAARPAPGLTVFYPYNYVRKAFFCEGISRGNAFLYPIDGVMEPASSARGAGGQLVRRYMLSRSLRRWTQAGVHLGSRAKGLLLVQISKTVHSPTNRLFKRDLPCYFWRSCGGHTRMAAMQIPPLPHAPPPYAVRRTVGVDTPAG